MMCYYIGVNKTTHHTNKRKEENNMFLSGKDLFMYRFHKVAETAMMITTVAMTIALFSYMFVTMSA